MVWVSTNAAALLSHHTVSLLHFLLHPLLLLHMLLVHMMHLLLLVMMHLLLLHLLLLLLLLLSRQIRAGRGLWLSEQT